MIDLGYVKTRLGWYAATWLTGFLIMLMAGLVGVMAGLPLVGVADAVLPALLISCGLALGAGLIAALVSDRSLGTKLLLLLLALVLVLPLLWGPVSALVALAYAFDVTVEYSVVYAGFRIGVSRILFPLSQWAFGENTFIEAVWLWFQGLATVVGFVSALANIWPLLRRLLGPEAVSTSP